MINVDRAVAPHNLLGYSGIRQKNLGGWKTSFKHPLEFLSKVSSLLRLARALSSEI